MSDYLPDNAFRKARDTWTKLVSPESSNYYEISEIHTIGAKGSQGIDFVSTKGQKKCIPHGPALMCSACNGIFKDAQHFSKNKCDNFPVLDVVQSIVEVALASNQLAVPERFKKSGCVPAISPVCFVTFHPYIGKSERHPLNPKWVENATRSLPTYDFLLEDANDEGPAVTIRTFVEACPEANRWLDQNVDPRIVASTWKNHVALTFQQASSPCTLCWTIKELSKNVRSWTWRKPTFPCFLKAHGGLDNMEAAQLDSYLLGLKTKNAIDVNNAGHHAAQVVPTNICNATAARANAILQSMTKKQKVSGKKFAKSWY